MAKTVSAKDAVKPVLTHASAKNDTGNKSGLTTVLKRSRKTYRGGLDSFL